jgi:hypothetical protein
MTKLSKEWRTTMKKPEHHMFAAKNIGFTVMLSLTAVIGFTRLSLANGQAYSYTKIASRGDTAPGGAHFSFDFEPGQINNRGDAIYVADLSPDGAEGVFLLSDKKIIGLALPGNSAPGGGTFDGFGFTPAGINDGGDAAFAEALTPFTFDLPLGINVGLYRYSADKNTVSSVVVPGVTTVPVAGTFQGVLFGTSINNRGEICFTGLIHTNVQLPPGESIGKGIFVADKTGKIRKVVIPGDLAPFGKTFDVAEVAWINNRGDVGFGAHVQGEEFVLDNVYLSKAPSFQIISIAHQGDPAPGGGTFRHAWGPILNDNRQLLFVGDLTPRPDALVSQGLFLYAYNGFTVPIVRPGDALPDGKLLTVSDFVNGHHLNNRGEISFLAALDTGDALYVKSGHRFRLVAKTGGIIPGVGTIQDFDIGTARLAGGAVNNDPGQVLFYAELVGGGAALIVATPMRDRGDDEGEE